MKQGHGLSRAVMLVLAVLSVLASLGRLKDADWFALAQSFYIPAALWCAGAVAPAAERGSGRHRAMGALAAISYFVFLIFVAFSVWQSSDKSSWQIWTALGLTAVAVFLLPLALAVVAGSEHGRRIFRPATCLPAGAALVIMSLFFSMETGTGWQCLTYQRRWVTAQYGAVSFTVRPVDWVARIAYGLAIVMVACSLALLVPRLRAGISDAAASWWRWSFAAIASLLMVDLYCGWIVYFREGWLFRESTTASVVATLAGGLLWLGATALSAGKSERAKRVRTELNLLFLPIVAADLVSCVVLVALEMYGSAALVFGLLLSGIAIAQLTRSAPEREERGQAVAA